MPHAIVCAAVLIVCVPDFAVDSGCIGLTMLTVVPVSVPSAPVGAIPISSSIWLCVSITGVLMPASRVPSFAGHDAGIEDHEGVVAGDVRGLAVLSST